ncbi:MAG: nucleolar RNA-binding Nop10p family protein [Candidatus Woesearchaeota archaeon]
MTHHILKCVSCESYGLSEACICGSKRIDPKPAKYSPDEKYAGLKRQAKLEKGIY